MYFELDKNCNNKLSILTVEDNLKLVFSYNSLIGLIFEYNYLILNKYYTNYSNTTNKHITTVKYDYNIKDTLYLNYENFNKLIDLNYNNLVKKCYELLTISYNEHLIIYDILNNNENVIYHKNIELLKVESKELKTRIKDIFYYKIKNVLFSNTITYNKNKTKILKENDLKLDKTNNELITIY